MDKRKARAILDTFFLFYTEGLLIPIQGTAPDGCRIGIHQPDRHHTLIYIIRLSWEPALLSILFRYPKVFLTRMNARSSCGVELLKKKKADECLN